MNLRRRFIAGRAISLRDSASKALVILVSIHCDSLDRGAFLLSNEFRVHFLALWVFTVDFIVVFLALETHMAALSNEPAYYSATGWALFDIWLHSAETQWTFGVLLGHALVHTVVKHRNTLFNAVKVLCFALVEFSCLGWAWLRDELRRPLALTTWPVRHNASVMRSATDAISVIILFILMTAATMLVVPVLRSVTGFDQWIWHFVRRSMSTLRLRGPGLLLSYNDSLIRSQLKTLVQMLLPADFFACRTLLDRRTQRHVHATMVIVF